MGSMVGCLQKARRLTEWMRFESSIKSNFQRRIVNIKCNLNLNSKYWCRKTLRFEIQLPSTASWIITSNGIRKPSFTSNKKIIDAYRIVNANSSMLRWGYCLSLSVNICFNSHINMHFSMQFRFSTISTGISTAWQEWLHKSKYALFGHVLFAAECLYLRIACYFTHIR